MSVRSQSTACTALREPLRDRARAAGAACWPVLRGICLGLLLVVLMSGETAARFMGFGQPPLAQRDQITEYRLLPDREYRRVVNRIAINRYGMRSDDFRREELDAVHHVLLVGDSIVCGEHWIDQSQTLAQHRLRLLREHEPGQPWLVSAAVVGCQPTGLPAADRPVSCAEVAGARSGVPPCAGPGGPSPCAVRMGLASASVCGDLDR
jgi:hypothetical protein